MTHKHDYRPLKGHKDTAICVGCGAKRKWKGGYPEQIEGGDARQEPTGEVVGEVGGVMAWDERLSDTKRHSADDLLRDALD